AHRGEATPSPILLILEEYKPEGHARARVPEFSGFWFRLRSVRTRQKQYRGPSREKEDLENDALGIPFYNSGSENRGFLSIMAHNQGRNEPLFKTFLNPRLNLVAGVRI